jgi:cytochrome c551/c552
LLEYGTGWFQKNPDAGLSVIEYTGGNRAPKISGIKVDKATGNLPFKVKATVDAKDPENDKVTYTWDLGNGTKQETKEPFIDFTYTTAGDYKISVVIKDDKDASSKSDEVQIYAGNETPEVHIELKGSNKSFFLPGQAITYAVSVTDKGDDSKIDPANLYVAVDYMQGYDKAAIAANGVGSNIEGKVLTQTMDCKSCHKESEKSIGPAFTLVSAKYAKNPDVVNYLSQKIRKGGAGVWGDVAMAAHPNISESDLKQIIQYVIGLSSKTVAKPSLPASGTFIPPANAKPGTSLVLSASYTDKGGNNIKALTGRNSAALNAASISFTGKEKVNGFSVTNYNGMNLMIAPAQPGWFALEGIDLTGVGSLNFMMGFLAAPKIGVEFEIHLDSETGKLLGKSTFLPAGNAKINFAMMPISISAITDSSLHNIYITSKRKDKETATVAVSSIQFVGK